MKTVVSLYDFTGEAVRPWAEAGYECWCYDIQHTYRKEAVGRGSIHYAYADLHDHNTLNAIQDGSTSRGGVAFGMAFLSALTWRCRALRGSRRNVRPTHHFKMRL
jgi:hypothetical protein